MKAQEIAKALAPFNALVNRNALSLVYRTLHITPERIIGCAAFGALACSIDIGVSDECFVDSIAFLGMVKSLPPGEELEIELKETSLNWKCGPAKGAIALVTDEIEYPDIVDKVTRRNAATVEKGAAFAKALELGALSCTNNTLSSVGMFGVVVEGGNGQLLVCSSDNSTIAECFVSSNYKLETRVTLPPHGAKLIETLIEKNDRVLVQWAETQVNVSAGALYAEVKFLSPLKHDIPALLARFDKAEYQAKIAPGRISAFMKRAQALAESNQTAYVEIGAKEGAIYLSFSDERAATDEYYLVEGAKIPDLAGVKLDIAKLARALSHAEYFILDYVEKHTLIIGAGTDESAQSFRYLIGGRKS